MPFSGTLSKVIYSILVAIVAYIILLVLAYVARLLGAASIGDLITKFAPIIAVLIGIGWFFSGRTSV